MLEISIICVLVVFLILSIILNFTFYKRLSQFEIDNQAREDVIYNKIEEFKKILKEHLQTIQDVAGLEVVSAEPFVRRVVKAIADAHDAFIELQVQLDNFELELDTQEENDEETE